MGNTCIMHISLSENFIILMFLTTLYGRVSDMNMYFV